MNFASLIAEQQFLESVFRVFKPPYFGESFCKKPSEIEVCSSRTGVFQHPVDDYKRFAVLYVDDEENCLKYFTRAFQDQFRVFTASSAREGLKILEPHKEDIRFLLANLNMPGEKGIWLLERARQLNPEIIGVLTFATALPNLVRVLTFESADYDGIVADVKAGTLYKFIHKPWDFSRIEAIIKRELGLFIVQHEHPRSLSEQRVPFQNGITADLVFRSALQAVGLNQQFRNALMAVGAYFDLVAPGVEQEQLYRESQFDMTPWKEFHQQVRSRLEKVTIPLQDLWTTSEPAIPGFADRVRLREIVSETVAELRDVLAVKAIRVRNEVSRFLPALDVDRPKFGRLFELLLRAEIATLPAGSRITLSATLSKGTQTGEQQIEVQVRDNGPYLRMPSLWFDCNSSAPAAEPPLDYGSHLLACYFTVHHHGGQIAVRRAAGKGIIYTLRFPVIPTRVEPSQCEPESLKKPRLARWLWEQLFSPDRPVQAK